MSGFLERWSRKKRAADEDAGKEGQTDEPVEVLAAPEEPAGEEDLPDEEVLNALPSLDEMTLDTNITPFLQRGVPRAMKNAALRKMWLLDPRIRNHKDFAVDYAWDWNTPGGVPGSGGAVSAESVAKLVHTLFSAPATKEAEAEAALLQEQQPESTEPEPEVEVMAAPANPLRQPAERGESSADRKEFAIGRSDIVDRGQENAVPATRRRHGGATPE
ncbi:DUF3306 domain-containing protein [Mesorhizobium sp. YIM 152430]|uniref:DUF3306 domain-containing protein n=1 Tax=Mesorhizobium sp. YIM 152430 TaxID=3031761 RepID=UPI0023DA52DB|nr:DUF3306 domain-containing protein [Mesorhizobium sp. YIM 152430]MDF1598717.1 DUF3306 domain-containing protein [Mesorhizobium sp. YIM 152430]